MIKVERYSPEYKEDWNLLIENSKNGTFLFNRDFMDYHSDRFQDYSLCIYFRNSLKAVLPANKVENNLWSHQGLSYGGLVIHREEKLERSLLYFREMLKTLDAVGISKLFYKQLPSFYHIHPAGEEEYALFLLGAKLFRRDTALVIDQQNQLAYQTRRKRSIKKAIKEGIEIRRDNNFELFWREILTPNLREKHGVDPVHTVDEIKLLASHFPNNIYQFNAYNHQGDIQAGVTIFETPSVAHAQYISASDSGRENGSIDLLFDHLIQTEFNNKRFFDFGISNEEQGQKLNHGLLDWKEGFGGRALSHHFYEIDTNCYSLLDKICRVP